MHKIASIVILLTLIFSAGCSSELYMKYAAEDPFQGMDEGTLLAQHGKPRRIIDTTEYGGPQTYSYLYMSAKGCVSTYTIIAATRQVSNYQCIE